MTVVPLRFTDAPVIDEAAMPLFFGTVKRLIEALIEQMNGIAEQQGVPIKAIRIRRFSDNDQGCPRLIVEQWLEGSGETSARFQDRFMEAIDCWYQTLPEEMAALFIDKVLFDFLWSQDESTR